jgi:predicted enzyme related to lactoylglutathione lyase
MTHGTVGWVQVGTDDPEGTKRFYGEMFDWKFATDPNSGGKYDLASYAKAERPHGGIFHTEDASANHAIFVVIVSDVAAAAAQAEQLGGKVVTPPTTTPTGLTFADLQDPAGNLFGVFKPPAQ